MKRSSLAGKGIALEPNFAFGFVFQGVGYGEPGRLLWSVRSLERAARLDRSATIVALGAHVHAIAGQKDVL